MKTTLAKKENVQRKWYVVDAAGQNLGRLSVKIANILRGRDKPTYTPHVDTGDFVIIINAEKIAVTGKKEEQKNYMFYTGWVGNEYYRTLADFREKRPEPRWYVYPGAQHGFDNATRPVRYHAEAAALARERTLVCLAEVSGG